MIKYSLLFFNNANIHIFFDMHPFDNAFLVFEFTQKYIV